MYPAIQRAVGCIDERPLEEPLAQYGIGITLYFKYLKVLIKIFGAYTLLAIPSMYYNWYGSGYTPAQKADMQEFDGVNPLFFTTLGSWGEKSVQCREGPEGTSFSMECSTGVFASLEAYYGQPTGSCSCPSDQQVVTDFKERARVRAVLSRVTVFAFSFAFAFALAFPPSALEPILGQGP